MKKILYALALLISTYTHAQITSAYGIQLGSLPGGETITISNFSNIGNQLELWRIPAPEEGWDLVGEWSVSTDDGYYFSASGNCYSSQSGFSYDGYTFTITNLPPGHYEVIIADGGGYPYTWWFGNWSGNDGYIGYYDSNEGSSNFSVHIDQPPTVTGETVAQAILPHAALAPASAVPLYRLYGGGGNNDHFYTTNYGEAMAAANSGYTYEGISCYVETSGGSGRIPLYRYFDRWYGRHFYTTNWNELGAGNAEWAYEGIQCYVYTAQARPGIVPLFRYSALAGGHLYSIAPTQENFGLTPLTDYILVYDPNSMYGWTFKTVIVGFVGSHHYDGIQGYVYAP